MLSRNQRGFTLVEIMIALCIGGLLSAGTASAIFQIGNVNDMDSAHVKAVKQVENAVHYIIRDVQSVRYPVVNNNAPFPLTLSWKTWEDNKAVQVIYSLNPQNGDLIRQYSENGGAPTNLTVARFISTNTANTHWSYDSATHMMTIKITATVTSGSKHADETRTISIFPRSGS